LHRSRNRCRTSRNPMRPFDTHPFVVTLAPVSPNDTIQPAAATTACHQDRPDPPLGCNRWLRDGWLRADRHQNSPASTRMNSNLSPARQGWREATTRRCCRGAIRNQCCGGRQQWKAPTPAITNRAPTATMYRLAAVSAPPTAPRPPAISTPMPAPRSVQISPAESKPQAAVA
jgi:hypothetical protein